MVAPVGNPTEDIEYGRKLLQEPQNALGANPSLKNLGGSFRDSILNIVPQAPGGFPAANCPSFKSYMFPASMMVKGFAVPENIQNFDTGNSQIEVTLNPCGLTKLRVQLIKGTKLNIPIVFNKKVIATASVTALNRKWVLDAERVLACTDILLHFFIFASTIPCGRSHRRRSCPSRLQRRVWWHSQCGHVGD